MFLLNSWSKKNISKMKKQENHPQLKVQDNFTDEKHKTDSQKPKVREQKHSTKGNHQTTKGKQSKQTNNKSTNNKF